MSKNKTKLHICNSKRGTSPLYSPVGQPPVLHDVCYLQNSDNNGPFLRGNNSSNIYSLAPPSWVSPHTCATMLIIRTTSRTATLAPDLRYCKYSFSPMFPSARLSSGTVCTASACSDNNGVTHNSNFVKSHRTSETTSVRTIEYKRETNWQVVSILDRVKRGGCRNNRVLRQCSNPGVGVVGGMLLLFLFFF